MKADAVRGHLDSLILSVLEAAPLHGYAIIAELKRRSGGDLALPEGTVYPALHRLEDSGLLSSAWSDANGRRRRVYSVTRRGGHELHARREEWSRFAATVDLVLAREPQVAPA
jgi:PadR family transcriptional regulator, regulatory protein PadR